jgi:hypothetical protein
VTDVDGDHPGGGRPDGLRKVPGVTGDGGVRRHVGRRCWLGQGSPAIPGLLGDSAIACAGLELTWPAAAELQPDAQPRVLRLVDAAHGLQSA